eukprot:Lithocolla_globosa_v1_NODE_153_length_5670_cov_4.374889.p3 type:complete len:114 gc:universal NODE_153_length_5670_cov_4.374889:4113-4454(+)
MTQHYSLGVAGATRRELQETSVFTLGIWCGQRKPLRWCLEVGNRCPGGLPPTRAHLDQTPIIAVFCEHQACLRGRTDVSKGNLICLESVRLGRVNRHRDHTEYHTRNESINKI